jgi:hypothetical protein
MASTSGVVVIPYMLVYLLEINIEVTGILSQRVGCQVAAQVFIYVVVKVQPLGLIISQ